MSNQQQKERQAMLSNLLILWGIFAYLSAGYYIAQHENQSEIAVRSKLVMTLYTLFGPAVIAAYTFFRVARFGYWQLAKVAISLAGYWPKKKAPELKPTEEVDAKTLVAIVDSLSQEEADRLKALESRPDAKVIHLQFPPKKQE